jgi:hypothetical protein
LHSSSKWWTHISSHLKICGGKPSMSVSYQCKWLVLISSLTSLCTFVSMHGTKQVQTLEHLGCVHYCESQSKWRLMKWHHTTTPRMKRIKSVLSVGKIIATVSRDEKGVIFFNSFLRGHQQTRITTEKC